jgi:hypothetical protein
MNNQSLIRRSFAVMVAAVLAVAFAVAGTSAPASAAVKGYLHIVSIADSENPQDGLADKDRPFDIVKDRPFNVVVEVRDAAVGGQLTTVTRETTVVLEDVSEPGVVRGTTRATIPRDGSDTTIFGATYSEFANGVEFRVRVERGVDLAPSASFSVNVALTAVTDPGSGSVDLRDENCDAPTSARPTCGRLLLPNGANSKVLMSVGACEGLGNCRSDIGALVVTAVADLGTLYANTPATLILACDKTICGGAGVPRLPVVYTFVNGEAPTLFAEECPAKGVTGSFDICVDYVQSTRNQGDLYTYILFDHDLRASHP